MKVWTILLGILCATATISVGQEPDRDSRAVNEIRSLEHSKFDALQRKDNATLDTIFDDAGMQVDQDGSLWTKADFLANSRSSTTKILRIAPESMSLRVFGDVALVIGIYEERGLKAGHPYVKRCRFIDTWAFKKGKWVCIAATATSAIS